jgi:hypothetical protein
LPVGESNWARKLTYKFGRVCHFFVIARSTAAFSANFVLRSSGVGDQARASLRFG